MIDNKNRSELDVVVEEVKQKLRGLFAESDELIKKLGNAMKKVVKKEHSICMQIKITLKEEIAQGLISARTIELHCPPEWKQRENEKISFSKQVEEKPQRQQIAATQDGKSVTINETSINTEAYPISSDDVNQPHNQSKQNRISNDDTADAGIKEELHSLNDEIASVNKQKKDMTDRKKEMFVSQVPMSFEDLQKDMDAVSQIAKKEGNIFFEVSVDLGTSEVKIEFCGITQQKDSTMISNGKGKLKATLAV